jgi:nicotinamidase-related amidase
VSAALVVIDVQNGMFGHEQQPHDSTGMLSRIVRLVRKARAASVPVIFVQHDGGAGHPLEKPSDGWRIHSDTGYRDSDTVVEKRHCDGFQDTDLAEKLADSGASDLVIAGMMTEYCVDTTTRRAFSLGYNVTLVSDGHSTFDTSLITADQIIAHHNSILSSGFAKLKPAAEIEFEGNGVSL